MFLIDGYLDGSELLIFERVRELNPQDPKQAGAPESVLDWEQTFQGAHLSGAVT